MASVPQEHPAGEVKHGVLVQLLRMLVKDWFYAWMAFTKQGFGLLITTTEWFAPTRLRVSGDESVRGQIATTGDNRLVTAFPERMVMISNHQVYTDWLYLWYIAYANRMHGHIYIICKESLKYIPIIGPGMMFYGFVFMARKWLSDKPRLEHRLGKLKERHGGPMSPGAGLDPMWLLIFPEGTNLSANTREGSKGWAKKQGIDDMRHQLLPRSTGLLFCLQQLKGTVDWVYDCTVAYEGVEPGGYAQDIFTLRSTYFQGRPPKSVNMYWRRYALSKIPLDDPKAFEEWLSQRWKEKDQLLEQYIQTGRFPADDGKSTEPPRLKGAGYINTEVKLAKWYEVGQIFVVLAALALVANCVVTVLDMLLWPIRGKLVQTKPFIDHNLLRDLPPSSAQPAEMAPYTNGYTNGTVAENQETTRTVPESMRFTDIPPQIDIPVSGPDAGEAVEVDLQDLLDDTNELCQLLENEKAPRNLWITIALAYAKQGQIDHAIDILDKGLLSVARTGPKEKLSLLNCICWLRLLKSRQAPRQLPKQNESTGAELKTKDDFLRETTIALNEALKINPSFPPHHLMRGVLQLLRASLMSSTKAGSGVSAERDEALRSALKHFDDAVKSSSGSNLMAILGMARSKYLLGRTAEALTDYQGVLGRKPSLIDPDPRIGIGCCLWRLGFKDQARAAWERSLSLNPDSKVANALLGIHYLYQSSQVRSSDPDFGVLYKTAMTQYTQKAYKLDKEFPLSCATFGNYFLLRKAYSTVELLARKAIEQTDVAAIASDGWHLLARRAHLEDQKQSASESYKKADDARGGLDRGYPPAKFGMIQMLIQSRDLDGAKYRLEKLIQTSKNPEYFILLGCLYAEEVFAAQASGTREDKSAELRKAITFLETVRKSWKDEKAKLTPDESVLLYLARLYETNQPIESMRCLEQVEQMQVDQLPDEDKPDPSTFEDSTKYAAAVRELLPPQLLNDIACFLYQFEKYDRARDTFQIALNACIKLSDKEREAEEESNVNADSLVTTISYNLARTYEALSYNIKGNFDEDIEHANQLLEDAKKVYEGLLQRHSDYTEASARLAFIALRQSPNDEGPKKIAKLYEAENQNVEVRALYGWYLNKSKRRVANIAEDQEQRHYKHTLQGYDKHDKYSLTGMGNIYLLTARDMRRDTDQDKDKRHKMYEKAVEFFDKALQLDPSNAYAAQGIAIALIDDKKDCSGALQILTRIRDTIRDDPSVYSNLGHVHSELRQFSRSIEAYEMALRKEKESKPLGTEGRDRDSPQILACLSRVWLLRGKAENNLTALKTSLEYSKRALDMQPDMVHFQFNVAFVQFQISQMIHTLSESQRTSEDVRDAQDGLEDAIEAFNIIAQVKQPPYPRGALEQRAAMGKNTMRRQLDRALTTQKEYEEKNAEKLAKARALREAEAKKKEDQQREQQRLELEKQEKIREERRKIIEETRERVEREKEEQRLREEAEMTTDSETGDRVKRKRKPGGKRKKREEGIVSDDDIDGVDGENRSRSRSVSGGDDEKPKKRRKLERKGKSSSKFKSADYVVDSDEDEDDVAIPAAPSDDEEDAVDAPTPAGRDQDGDEEMADQEAPAPAPAPAAPRQPPRRRKQLRVIANEEEDEDEDEDMPPASDAFKRREATSLTNGGESEAENAEAGPGSPLAPNGDEIEDEEAAAMEANVNIAEKAMAAVEGRHRAENEVGGMVGDEAFE
ncbi:MAG: hypothetical protein Q9227_009298 [Pyrenula ochraceoflavens]